MPELQKETDRPDWVRPEVEEHQEDLDLVHDLLAGTRRMWEKAKIYIRQWADEKDKVFRIRSKSETVFEGLSRTLSAAVGMLWAQKPRLDWNGATQIEEHWDSIDGAGTKGHVWAKQFSDAAIRDGLSLILVDFPPPPRDEEGNRIQVDADIEDALALRPFWTKYGRDRILNWRAEEVNNETILTLVVLHEPTKVPSGVYGIATEDRYRVLRLLPEGAAWFLYRKIESEKQDDSFQLMRSGLFRNRVGQPKRRLPVSVAYTGKKRAEMVADIPLLGVAWANLSHWRKATNLGFYEDLACFPQPTVKGKVVNPGSKGHPQMEGTQAGSLKIGPMVPVQVSEGGDFGWTELEGSSLEHLRRAVEAKRHDIGQLGMSFLVKDTRAAETAEAKRLDATAENATLATAAQGIEDAINEAYAHHAWYLGIDRANTPVLTINRDFENLQMDAQTMTAYVNAIDKAGLPVRLLLQAWQDGGRIGPDVDLEELEMEMLANAAAKQAQEEAEREAMREAAEAGDNGGPPVPAGAGA